jgi:hypothetical protein
MESAIAGLLLTALTTAAMLRWCRRLDQAGFGHSERDVLP